MLDLGEPTVISHFRSRGSANQWVTGFYVFYGDDLDDIANDPIVKEPATGR